MASKLWLVGIVMVCLAAAPAMAIIEYQGSLSIDCIDAPANSAAPNSWNYAATSVSWTVTYTGSLWHYKYDFSVPSKDFSHVIIETSEGATISNLNTGTYEGAKLYTPNDPGNSNPELPGNIFGIKFAPTGDTTNYGWEFDTDRAPVWGDFYAKDGVNNVKDLGKTDVVMWNKSFGDPDPDDDPANGTINCKILRPDTETTPRTPELSTWMLLGISGLVGVFAARRRRQ